MLAFIVVIQSAGRRTLSLVALCFRSINFNIINLFTEICPSHALIFFLLRICTWQAVLQIYHMCFKWAEEQNEDIFP